MKKKTISYLSIVSSHQMTKVCNSISWRWFDASELEPQRLPQLASVAVVPRRRVNLLIEQRKEELTCVEKASVGVLGVDHRVNHLVRQRFSGLVVLRKALERALLPHPVFEKLLVDQSKVRLLAQRFWSNSKKIH